MAGFFSRIGNLFGRKDPLVGEAPQWLKNLKLEQARQRGNGSIRRPRATPFDYLLVDVLEAGQTVDTGKVGVGAEYWAACFRDSVFLGLISTRSAGLVSLPRTFKGTQAAKDFLQQGFGGNTDDPQSGFDLICPPQELAALVQDGVGLGVGVAQLVEIEGLDFPVLARLDPTALEYRPYENIWQYNTDSGPIAITPGVNGWVLYTPGGRIQPWKQGCWLACSKATTRKEHALLSLDEYLYRYGLPARMGVTPEGAGDADKQAFQDILEDWGNTALSGPQGFDVKLLELKGDGAKVFIDLVNSCNDETIMTLAGQKVTVDGGAGFSNSDIHRAIRQDLIKQSAQALADCLNSQVLPQALAMKFGIGAEEAFISWNVEPPKDLKARADGLIASANAIKMLTGKELGTAVEVDVRRLSEELQIPMLKVVEIVAPVAALPVGDATSVQDTALNGAQVSSLLEIISQVVAGLLPRETALQIIVVAFNKTPEQADTLLGPVGQGFSAPNLQVVK